MKGKSTRFSGKAELEGWWNGMSRKQTVHHGHMPDIEITSPTTAKGIWAMEDKLRFADGTALHPHIHIPLHTRTRSHYYLDLNLNIAF